MSEKLKLFRKEGKVYAKVDDKEAKVVRILWARPISGRDEEVSLLSEKNEEVAFLENLDLLEEESRQIAREELDKRYLIPKIEEVLQATSYFGNRIVEVRTNMGKRSFAIKDPNRSILRPSADQIIFRCAIGNRYEIPSLSSLDERSRKEIAKVI